jgi:hypothetical protein
MNSTTCPRAIVLGRSTWRASGARFLIARRNQSRRTATNHGRSVEAAAPLRPVYDRLTEGFETANLKRRRRSDELI